MPIFYYPHAVTADKNNVTASRAMATVYTNNTNRPIQVVITMTHEVTAVNQPLLAQLSIGGLGMAWGGWYNTPAAGPELYSCIVGNVAPGETYELTETATGGNNNILRWIEVTQ